MASKNAVTDVTPLFEKSLENFKKFLRFWSLEPIIEYNAKLGTVKSAMLSSLLYSKSLFYASKGFF